MDHCGGLRTCYFKDLQQRLAKEEKKEEFRGNFKEPVKKEDI